jgi:hypothetical protein
MFYRRLLAGLVVLGALVCMTVPVSAQKEKEKGKKEKDKGKKDKGKKDKEKPKEGKDKAITLKWKFKEGKTFYQTMTTTTKQTMKVMNNDVTQTQEQTFHFSWTPVKEKDNKWTIKQKIEGVKMNIDIGGSKIAYDSTKEGGASNPLGDFFKALVGSEFTLTLDMKTLKVTAVEGRKKFLEKLVAANPQMKPLLETILSEDALKEMAEPTFAVVPEKNKPVTKGQKWQKGTSLNMGPIGTYDNTYVYTYDGKNDKGLATIKVETTLKYKPPKESTGAGGLPFKIKSADLKSTSASGTVTFNQEKGRVEKSTMKLNLSGKLSIEIGGQQTTVELSQTQESTVETTDTNPVKKG